MARQELIIPAKDVEIWITVLGVTVKLDTSSRLSRSFVQTLENIYAIGSGDPIGVSDSNASYTITLTAQSGEYQVILNAINAAVPAGGDLHASFLKLPPFTLTYAHKMLNMIVPSQISTTMFNCRVSDDSEDVSANDPATYSSIGMQGTGIKRVVVPIP